MSRSMEKTCRRVQCFSSVLLTVLHLSPSHAFNSFVPRYFHCPSSTPSLCQQIDGLPLRISSMKASNLRTQPLSSLRMNGDPQWYAFSQYNLGRWQGKALHIDPGTGEYVEPYIIRNYVLDVVEVERETAVERFIGEQNEMLNLEPVAHETTIRPDDDFDATIDGFYVRFCAISHDIPVTDLNYSQETFL